MSLLDVLFLPLDLVNLTGTLLAGLDRFREWRRAASDARIRAMWAKRPGTK